MLFLSGALGVMQENANRMEEWRAYMDTRIIGANITRSVKTWKDFLVNPMQRDMYSNVLYGVLRYYDLPDLIRLSGKAVRFVD